MAAKLHPDFLRLPIAHRGLHDRSSGIVENSPSAFGAAMDAGYGIELDLQLSSDGQAMVFHDEALDRLTALKGAVNDHSADDLSRIALSGTKDTIPTLRDVLAQVAGRVPLLIELKDQTLTLGESDGRLEAATATALSGYGGPVAVMSFNPSMIAHMARLAPQITRGITTSSFDPQDWAPMDAATCDRLRDIPDYDAVGASFISHQGDDLDRPRVTELRAQGAAILCWTIKSPAQEALARQSADNITFEQYLAPVPA
jgi:glycerophosphoryl diester phosphodiesterase